MDTVTLIETEFPEFPSLELELPEGFRDTSWHHDVCPSYSDGQGLTIWIDHPDWTQSEWGEPYSDTCTRFALEVDLAPFLLRNFHPGNNTRCLRTNDWQDIVSAVEVVRGAIKQGLPWPPVDNLS